MSGASDNDDIAARIEALRVRLASAPPPVLDGSFASLMDGFAYWRAHRCFNKAVLWRERAKKLERFSRPQLPKDQQ